ncbi:30690_t:CDS:2, partial [Racocetra persica]
MSDRLLPRQNNGETNIDWISRMIKEKRINFIDNGEFEKPVFVKLGGSGVIRKTLWKTKNKDIILKEIVPEEVITEPELQELIKEIKAFDSIRVGEQSDINKIGYPNVIECFGVSRFNEQEPFLLVLEHADIGCLRDYLNNHHDNLKWGQKINIARQITCGLHFLHKNGILHRDLNTQNIVIKRDETFEDGIRVIIIDFGLSKVVPRKSISHQRIKGHANFVDPVILEASDSQFGEIYRYQSDIYSLGVTFWEISSNGQQTKKNIPPDIIILNRIKGERERPVAGSTRPFVELYQKCWDHNPQNRPDIYQVHESIYRDDIISGE